jgi:hypothetical protein
MTDSIPSPPPEQEVKHLAEQCTILLRENERLRADAALWPILEAARRDNERLQAALQEIADLRYDNTSAAEIAQRVLAQPVDVT